MDDGDNVLNLIWIATLGKLLVQKSVLTHQEIIDEIETYRGVAEHDLAFQAELDNMINAVRRW